MNNDHKVTLYMLALAYNGKKINKLHHLTERDSLTHYFALFCGSGLRLGNLATSGAKSNAIYSCSVTPISCKGYEISQLSDVVVEI